MVFGFTNGMNSSWEYAPNTIHGEAFEDYSEELLESSIPAGKKRIDYVLITDAINEGVALEQWETAEPMSDRALEKFDSQPFIKIFDNGEAQIYFVDF
jgi:hypothetical protein